MNDVKGVSKTFKYRQKDIVVMSLLSNKIIIRDER